MSVSEAYEHGKKAFDDGADINHVPGHYTTIEIENFQAGYTDRQNSILEQDIFADDPYGLEDPSLYADQGDEE